jgi:hypothetical protein
MLRVAVVIENPVRRFSQFCEKRLLVSSCPSVHRSAWKNSVPTGRILITLDKRRTENFSKLSVCWGSLSVFVHKLTSSALWPEIPPKGWICGIQ